LFVTPEDDTTYPAVAPKTEAITAAERLSLLSCSSQKTV
jgi:hypothetical protein